MNTALLEVFGDRIFFFPDGYIPFPCFTAHFGHFMYLEVFSNYTDIIINWKSGMTWNIFSGSHNARGSLEHISSRLTFYNIFWKFLNVSLKIFWAKLLPMLFTFSTTTKIYPKLIEQYILEIKYNISCFLNP